MNKKLVESSSFLLLIHTYSKESYWETVVKKKYSTLQIKTEVKERLDAFCDARGYKLSGFVEKLIESSIDWTPVHNYTTAATVMYTACVHTGSQYSQSYSQSYC